MTEIKGLEQISAASLKAGTEIMLVKTASGVRVIVQLTVLATDIVLKGLSSNEIYTVVRGQPMRNFYGAMVLFDNRIGDVRDRVGIVGGWLTEVGEVGLERIVGVDVVFLDPHLPGLREIPRDTRTTRLVQIGVSVAVRSIRHIGPGTISERPQQGWPIL